MYNEKESKLEKIIVSLATVLFAALLVLVVMISIKYTKYNAGNFKNNDKVADFKFYYYVTEHLLQKKDGSYVIGRYVYVTHRASISEIPEREKLEQQVTDKKDIKNEDIASFPRILNPRPNNGNYVGFELSKDKYDTVKSESARTFGTEKFRKVYKLNLEKIHAEHKEYANTKKYEIKTIAYYLYSGNASSIILRDNPNFESRKGLPKNLQVLDLTNNSEFKITEIRRDVVNIYALTFAVFVGAFLIYQIAISSVKIIRKKKKTPLKTDF